MLKASELYSFPESLPFANFFDPEAAPWEWLNSIANALDDFDFELTGKLDSFPAFVRTKGKVWIHQSVEILGPCTIEGPCYIGPDVQIRPGAYIRGNVIVGKGSVLGNSCEYKNCLLMENVESAHFNYVGDSVLGNKAHLGAGVICANLRLARDEVVVRINGEKFPTNRRKVGAFLGEEAEVGCNSVLQPGTILGKRAAVISMPFQGYLPADKMAIMASKPRILTRPRS